jgi:hypothetical protein
MAENIVATAGTTAEEFMRTTRRRELVKLAGTSTAAADTSNTYTCAFLTAPAKVEGGAFAGTFSGRTVVFTSLIALGTNDVWVWISE